MNSSREVLAIRHSLHSMYLEVYHILYSHTKVFENRKDQIFPLPHNRNYKKLVGEFSIQSYMYRPAL